MPPYSSTLSVSRVFTPSLTFLPYGKHIISLSEMPFLISI